MKEFQKVFGIGLSKTGTTTLGRCFEVLGLVPHIGFHEHFKTKVLRGDDLQPLLDFAENYRSFEDSPWYLLYQELDECFPGSKFILTLRKDSRTHALSSWKHGVQRGVRRNDPPEEYLREKMELYERHNNEVRQYFRDRPGDLLEICWETGDGWEKLCPFLDCEIPSTPIPRLNVNVSSKIRSNSLLKLCYDSAIGTAIRREVYRLLRARRALQLAVSREPAQLQQQEEELILPPARVRPPLPGAVSFQDNRDSSEKDNEIEPKSTIANV